MFLRSRFNNIIPSHTFFRTSPFLPGTDGRQFGHLIIEDAKGGNTILNVTTHLPVQGPMRLFDHKFDQQEYNRYLLSLQPSSFTNGKHQFEDR